MTRPNKKIKKENDCLVQFDLDQPRVIVGTDYIIPELFIEFLCNNNKLGFIINSQQ